uniref:Macrophage-expressed gene 1 protein n=1 Tax=Stegastes partitus TaxID=144197 RepID=A0A3B4Z7D4_9TELE
LNLIEHLWNKLERPTNWLRQCRASTNLSVTALEVLPGGGWDNLRNMDMGRVMNISYLECQTTEDGLYLIPDEVFVIPHKETGVETNSEIINSWLEQKSSTSHSVNVDVSFLPKINGKFSTENKRMKTHQVQDSSATARVQVCFFGGVYQECVQLSPDAGPLCDTLTQKNPDTGDFSCRSPYLPTLLRSEMKQQSYTSYDCYEERYDCGLFDLFTCTEQVCGNNNHVRSARINTYWCSVNGKAPENSGYLFGGMYSPSVLNPLTKTKSCPLNFIPLRFLSDGQMICVSNEFETGTRYAVPFAGFFSCQSSNPLARNQRSCPPTFSQHLAAVSDGCEILYCVQSNLSTGGQLKPVLLPPFTKPPLVTMQHTNTVMVMTDGDMSWVRVGQTKTWKIAKAEDIKHILQSFNQEARQMSGGEKAGVAFGVMGMMLVVVVVVVVLVRRRRRRRGGYTEIHEEAERETQLGDSAPAERD